MENILMMQKLTVFLSMIDIHSLSIPISRQSSIKTSFYNAPSIVVRFLYIHSTARPTTQQKKRKEEKSIKREEKQFSLIPFNIEERKKAHKFVLCNAFTSMLAVKTWKKYVPLRGRWRKFDKNSRDYRLPISVYEVRIYQGFGMHKSFKNFWNIITHLWLAQHLPHAPCLNP